MANEKNLTSWKPGQSGNPKGAPKKTTTALVDKLEKEGYEVPSRAIVIKIYRLLFSLDESELKTLKDDKEQPYHIRAMIEMMLDKKNRMKLMEEMRNYAFKEEEAPRITYNVDVSAEEAKQIMKDIQEEL